MTQKTQIHILREDEIQSSWVITLDQTERTRLLSKRDWSIREAAFYLNDLQDIEENQYYYIDPPLSMVENLTQRLLADLEGNVLHPAYTKAALPRLTKLPVAAYMEWAVKHWEEYFPDSKLPNIVVAYQKRTKDSSELSLEVQYLMDQGVPVGQLLGLIRQVYDFSFDEDGEMLSEKVIKKLPKYLELSGSDNLESVYPDLPSTKLLDVVLRIIRKNKGKKTPRPSR